MIFHFSFTPKLFKRTLPIYQSHTVSIVFEKKNLEVFEECFY